MLRRVAFRNQLVYVNQTIMVVGICTQQSPESCTHVDKLFPSHFRDNSDDGWWISHYLVVIVGFGLQYLQYSVVTLSYSSKKKPLQYYSVLAVKSYEWTPEGACSMTSFTNHDAHDRTYTHIPIILIIITNVHSLVEI